MKGPDKRQCSVTSNRGTGDTQTRKQEIGGKQMFSGVREHGSDQRAVSSWRLCSSLTQPHLAPSGEESLDNWNTSLSLHRTRAKREKAESDKQQERHTFQRAASLPAAQNHSWEEGSKPLSKTTSCFCTPMDSNTAYKRQLWHIQALCGKNTVPHRSQSYYLIQRCLHSASGNSHWLFPALIPQK